MEKVIIQNGNREMILSFDEETKKEFIKAVNNCLKNSIKYPVVNYSDKKDDIIFTANYLKNSLILMPKN